VGGWWLGPEHALARCARSSARTSARSDLARRLGPGSFRARTNRASSRVRESPRSLSFTPLARSEGAGFFPSFDAHSFRFGAFTREFVLRSLAARSARSFVPLSRATRRTGRSFRRSRPRPRSLSLARSCLFGPFLARGEFLFGPLALASFFPIYLYIIGRQLGRPSPCPSEWPGESPDGPHHAFWTTPRSCPAYATLVSL
jgi:hypothetical protein